MSACARQRAALGSYRSRGARAAIIAVVAASALAYSPTLDSADFFYDDQAIIAQNPLMRQGWPAAWRLFQTGYWQPVRPASTVDEYRPLLMLSFLLQVLATGFSAGAMHAANLGLHIAVSLLLWTALRNKQGEAAAAAGALIFAVMPVHMEAVAALVGRSELMVGALLLAFWLCLDGRFGLKRALLGALLFATALLIKESAIMMPLFLAMSDWCFHGCRPWDRKRRGLYLCLGAVAAAYMGLRFAIFARVFHGGAPYFQNGRLISALTLSVFFWSHYAWPSLSGLGICADFSRPLIVDSSPHSAAAWACLAALILGAAFAAMALLRKRSPWAFWALGPGLFLLPISHQFFKLDTIGAQRWLYVPTMGLAAAWGWAFKRMAGKKPTAAAGFLAAAIAGYGGLTFAKAATWRTGIGFYQDAISCNPVSRTAQASLGTLLARSGRTRAGRDHLARALSLDPGWAETHYDLGRLAWAEHDHASAEKFARKALQLKPNLSDAWVLLGLIHESRGELDIAKVDLQRAIQHEPSNAQAHFNLGRLGLIGREPSLALSHWKQFLALAPDDPDAKAIISIVLELERGVRH